MSENTPTTADLARAAKARAEAATEGPWEPLGTGVAGGDHWYVCDGGEAIALISTQDGINEAQREPDAAFIAAARTDVPLLADAVLALTAALANAEVRALPDREAIARRIYASDWPDRWEEEAENIHRDYLRNADAVLALFGQEDQR